MLKIPWIKHVGKNKILDKKKNKGPLYWTSASDNICRDHNEESKLREYNTDKTY